jgi:hypothetical protein
LVFYPRDEKITAKGKGELQTYWLGLSAASMEDRMSVSTGSLKTAISRHTVSDRRMVRHISGRPVALADVQTCRLVDWIVDTLSPMLNRIVRIDSEVATERLFCFKKNIPNSCIVLLIVSADSENSDSVSKILLQEQLTVYFNPSVPIL